MNYDYLLKTFLSSQFRFGSSSLQYPHTIGEYTYASESHVLIKVPIDKAEIYNQKDSPDFESVIDQNIFDKGKSFVLKRDDLFRALINMQINYAYSQKKCEKCEGKGYKTCNCCNHENDCNDCKGKGDVEDKNSFAVRGVTIIDEDGDNKRRLQIGDIFMSPTNADILAQTMIFTRSETIEIFHYKTKAQIKINDILILIMLHVEPLKTE